MDVTYQQDTTFTDIALQLATPTPQNDNININNPSYVRTQHAPEPQPKQHLSDTSHNSVHNKIYSDVTVIQNNDHVITPNANDVVDVANLVDHVVTSRGMPKTLRDSIHV